MSVINITSLAPFFILIITFCFLRNSSCLFCKDGQFDGLSGRKYIVEKFKCNDDKKSCYAATCTAWDQPGNVRIYWGCANSTWSDQVTLPLNTKKSEEHVRIEWGCAKKMECSAISAVVEKDTKMAGINCECKFGLKNVDFGNSDLRVTPKGRTTTTVSTTETRTKRTRTTTESTSTTKPSPSFANVKIGNKIQCMAKNICDLSVMWKRAKLTKRFEIRKKCEEIVKNWAQMTEKISTEYENADNKNSAVNKNGQVFLADFIGARTH